MQVQAWPAGLDHRPILEGYVFQAGGKVLATPMEAGTRKRPQHGPAPAHVELVWPFRVAAFDLFRSWYRVELDDGARHFRMEVWDGAAWQDSLCRFARMYEPALRGLEWHVTAELTARPYVIAPLPEEV